VLQECSHDDLNVATFSSTEVVVGPCSIRSGPVMVFGDGHRRLLTCISCTYGTWVVDRVGVWGRVWNGRGGIAWPWSQIVGLACDFWVPHLAGSGRVLCEGGIYIGGLESIGGRECNMMDPGCGSVRL
jgi:hypothetical protein